MEISVTFSDNLMMKEHLKVEKKLSGEEFYVYQMYSSIRSTRYVLKLFPKNELGMAHYQKEKLMFPLAHHNIIHRIPAIYFNKGFLSIFTEFAKYGDIFEFVDKGVFNNDVIIRSYFHQLIEGIEYIHSQGVAHLDLKLENLLIGSNFILKIADFDQAQKITDRSLTSGVSRCYRPPEVINNTCKNLRAVDIYCAGVILYAFKTKEFPFADSKNPKALELGSYSTFVCNNELFWKKKAEMVGEDIFFDRDFIEIVNGMLCANPEERWTIEDIKRSKWYQGPILESKKLKAYMKFQWENVMKID